VATKSGYRYWVTFIDDHSRWCVIVLLRKKSKTLAAFQTYKVFVEKQTGKQIICLHDDKGGGFIGNEWDAFMQAEGIQRKHTVQATPQQNGVAERKNRTLAERITAMLNEAKLPASFWGEALPTANFLLNIAPSCSVAVGKTPFKLWHGCKPDYSILRVFGCRAYTHIGRDKRKSLESKTLPCLFLGYPEDYKGWKLYDPRAQRIVISRDIIWNEEEFPGTSCAVVPHLSVLTEPEEPLPRREDDEEDTPDVVGAEPDPALPPVPPAPPARPVTPKREPEAGSAPQQQPPVTPRRRHAFFDLKSPSSAPRTPPVTTVPLVVPPTPEPALSQPRRRRAPVQEPSPQPEPGPSRRSTRSNKGHAPPANQWNATDYLHGNQQPQKVKSYKETGTCSSVSPAPQSSPSPDPESYREPTPAVSSEEEEEDDNEPGDAGPTTGSDKDEEEDDDSDELELLQPREHPAARLALRLAKQGVVPAPVRVRALLAQGLRSVYDPVEYCKLPEVMEHAYQAALASAGAAGSPGDPKTFKEAMASPDADKWYEAMVTEMQAHVKNGTWELVELPRGRKAIGSKWVFKIKRAADGSVDRYKARLVAKGFSQRPGIDFDETFAPTTKWAALRAIFAIAALEDLELESIDISNAYLNGELKDVDVYMTQPEGFAEQGGEWVAKLIKGLYGLKQGGRCWFERLEEVLLGMGFTRIRSDASIFVWDHEGTKVIVPVFVDDITLASKSKTKIQDIKQELAQHFKL
jgi:transposase InsO family protein